jgi:hypothetical protein
MSGMESEIDRWIDQFLADDDERFGWLKERVHTRRFLPLYVGWIATLGITAGQEIVRIESEGDVAEPEPVADAFSRRLAICQGAKKYPSLITLLAERPASAVDCASCSGRGEIDGAPRLVCECGGAGWLIPGEARVDGAG